MMTDETGVDEPHYWDIRYRNNQDSWDMGTPTPVFVDLLESGRFEPGKTLVLGCGKGYDAVLFAQHGFPVTAIDFSPEAIKHTRSLAEEKHVALELVQEDIFDYSLGISGEFDYVVEYVTFCAIDPSRRPEFASVVPSLMKPAGRFIGLFFPLDNRSGGPPFSVSMDEVNRLFGKKLELISVEAPERSVSPRRGKEILTIWRKL
ncbi:MAG: methyltransferase domain-containing protein [Bacteroidetes bacterium]|nr:methyltransferase domain-containing protein [Bacteroidota bacterium]MCW5896939.1 methyltransferase domain-containing protein [Bacteroidota bacterium]